MPSLYVFAIQIYLFGAVALYLHYRSEDYGFAPLLFYVAGIMGVFNIIELMTLFIEPASGIVLRPGGHVFVPIILLIVLIVYITNGTRSARITIAGLIGVDVLVLVVLAFLLLYLNVKTPSTTIRGLLAEKDILTPLFLRGVLASTLAFTADMFVIAIVYQGILNAFPSFSKSLIPGVALIVALWVDTILYNLLGLFGTFQFVSGIPGDILMKTLAGLLLSPLVCWYLARVAPRLTHYLGAENRSTLDILFGEGEFASRVAQLESELQVSRAIYEQIIQHIDEIFWLVDIKRERLLYLSPNFEKLTGQAPERFYKNPGALIRLVHPGDRAENIGSQVFFSPESEFRIRREDGSFRWFRNRSFPIITPDQQVVRYAGIAEDITARREAQDQTFALELSREKVNLLHRFIRDASHDLRSPLSTILLRAQMLGKVDDDRRKKVVDEIREAAQRLNKLIDDMFTLSRIEGEEQVEHVLLNLNTVVEEVYGEYQVLAHDRHLGLALHLTDRAVPVVGNKDQLFRLVANLIDNAIHYTHQGSVTVTTLVDGDRAALEVTDTGIGIPKAYLESIFERFYRTAKAREMRRDGTGLGLAISKAIVEQHQGAIAVQSAVGEGTTFQVIFPIDQAHQSNPV